MRNFSGIFGRALATVAIAGAAFTAQADLSGYAFSISASNDDGTATYNVPLENLTYDPDDNTWTWFSGPVDLEDDEGDLIAVLNNANVYIAGDPAINFGFAVNAGNTDTTFSITTASLSFAALNNPDAQAGAGFSITDQFNHDGAELSTLNRVGRAYNASYNSGTTFADLVKGFKAVGSGHSENSDENKPADGFETIAGSVSQMSASVNFKLTAGDLASGTNSFKVVPEPSTLALVALGALSMLRRNR